MGKFMRYSAILVNFVIAMSYNLVIDQGNSTAKIAVFEGDSLVEQWRCEDLLPEVLRRVAVSAPIEAAIYCSVTHHSENIIVTLREIAGKVYELTSLLPLPITIGYATPSSLGRDRIAAVAGARAMLPGRTVLVVDAGTAITYDVLQPDGNFLRREHRSRAVASRRGSQPSHRTSAARQCRDSGRCGSMGHRHPAGHHGRYRAWRGR